MGFYGTIIINKVITTWNVAECISL